jgi:glutamate/aspartate transport system substrate-binding protein
MFRRVSCIAAGIWFCAALATSAHAIEVRTAAQDSQPKFIKEGTAITGLCIDLIKAIERTDADLKFPALTGFMPLPRIEASMLEGTLDASCGLAASKERKEKFDVIDISLYTTHLVLAARKDEKADPKTFDEIKNLGDDAIVLTVTQTGQAALAGAQSGLKVDSAAKDTSQNLQKLIINRGRFILHNDFALVDEIKRDGLGDKVKLLSGTFATEGRYFIVSKKASPVLKEKLTAALEKLSKSGELAKIFTPYKPK